MGVLQVENLTKHYAARKGAANKSGLLVFENLSFTLPNGQFTSIIGHSGCGKTTVLNLAAGLDQRTGGTIRVDDKLVTGPGLDRGVVFQEFALFPWLTVADNIAFGLKSKGVSAAERAKIVAHFVELVGLSQFKDYYPNTLSGGMRQRVGLGRALAIDPAVLLMDEPFGALDAQTRESMQVALSDIWTRNSKTILFITHDIREAVYLSDRVLVMAGRPSEIVLDLDIDLPRPRDRHGARFKEYEAMLEAAIVSSESTAAKQPTHSTTTH